MQEANLNQCLTCRRKLRTCICSEIKPFETASRFVILMHPKEFKKEKVGTGRFTHLILKNSKVLVDVGFDENKEFLNLLNDPEYQSYVLYPGEETINLSGESVDLGKKKSQFFVIDGTWACAKKMMKLTTTLHQVPRVSFVTDRRSEFKIKHQPSPECLSTVESIHQVLLDLNRAKIEHTEGKEENLMATFRHMVQIQSDIALDPANVGYRRKPFSFPEDRRMSKKWESRSIFFKTEDE